MGAPGISDAAVARATGRDRDYWFAVLDTFRDASDHTARARRLAETHPELPGWWCQGIVVAYEKARGLRVEGESTGGGFQVSCSRTLPADRDGAWAILTTTPFLPGADWTRGATWDAGDAQVEVRRVDPGRMLRWWWRDARGRSTVEVDFQERDGRTGIRFRHHGLPDQEARERYRARWKQALAMMG